MSTSSDPQPIEPRQLAAVRDLVERQDVGLVYQPIVDLENRSIYAYEALARPKGNHFSNTLEMFRAAVAAGCVAELGRLHRTHAVRNCPNYPLFLNVDPHEFDYGWLVRPDDPMFRHKKPVCLEITESVPLKFFDQCQSVLAEIRERGISLAIDDLGAGFSNLKYISDLAPQVVKLDRELIIGIEQGTRQFRLLRSIVRLCSEMDAKVVVEGVETIGELDAVCAAGAKFCQGYLLARPAMPPPEVDYSVIPRS